MYLKDFFLYRFNLINSFPTKQQGMKELNVKMRKGGLKTGTRYRFKKDL